MNTWDGKTETRDEKIARLEADGRLDPNCPGCASAYAHPTVSPFAPHHEASDRCESGKRSHCTCPVCWG